MAFPNISEFIPNPPKGKKKKAESIADVGEL